MVKQSALVVIASFLIATSATAKWDPTFQWQTLDTPHFRIHFYQGGENLARMVAAYAEEAHARCLELFGLTPSEVIEIVLCDDVDEANGFASVLPYDRIVLLAQPPGPESGLASFENYVRTLVYHEYAHILHMDQVTGVLAFVNAVLGKTALPNAAMPTWFKEGFAVTIESILTAGGRTRSSLFDMYLRAAALADKLLYLSQLTVTPMILPRGEAPYVYGSRFMDFLIEKHGISSIIAFIKDQAGRVNPLSLNLLARRHFGETLTTLYERFLESVREDARRHAERVAAEGEVAGVPLTTEGEYHGKTVFSLDGRAVYFVKNDGHETEGIYELDPWSVIEHKEEAGPRRIADCYGGCGSLAVSQEGLLTTHIAPWRLTHAYGDIYFIDKTGNERRLTIAARAHDVFSAADGTIYFTTSEWGRPSLMALEPVTNMQRVVVPPGRFDGIATPKMMPNARMLVFAAAAQGQWDIWTYDLTTMELARLTDDPCLDRDPIPTPDGKWVLFVTDRKGTFNVYALRLATRELYRVTNVLGGAFWPAISPDGNLLVFSSWSSRGYDLAAMRLGPASFIKVDGPGAGGCRSFDTSPPQKPIEGEIREYSPWPSVRPRSLSPIVRVATDGTSALGAEVSGFDAVGLHSFAASFESSVTSWSPTAALSYSYLGWWPDLTLQMGTWPSNAKARIDDRWRLLATRAWGISPSISITIPGRERSFMLGVAYSLVWNIVTESHPRGKDPASLEPIMARNRHNAALTIFAEHDSTESYVWSISAERGFQARLSLSLRHPVIGAEGAALTATASLGWYLKLPWAKHHVLAMLFSGDMSFGDQDARDIFALGGFPNQDLASAIINHQPLVGRFLRGFPPQVALGHIRLLGNVEYRLPIVYLHRGIDTFPSAAKRLWAVLYTDAGGAWWSTPDDICIGAGGELALSYTLGNVMESVLRLGYAHGFGPLGEDVFYVLITR